MASIRNLILSTLLFIVCVITLTTTWSAVLADVPRPRGVSLDGASLYYPRSDQTWQCLDGTKNIKYTHINDDFCDCADGSDEPGTAACPGGTFHCINKGHRFMDVPSSRVNDGICDCCDGSDEYDATTGTPLCKNTCYDMGRAEQAQRLLAAEMHKKGAAKREEMIARGKQLREERENRRSELEERRREVEVIKMKKDELKKQAEAIESEALELFKEIQKEKEEFADVLDDSLRQEATASFNHYDTNKDGYVEVTELQIDMTLDVDRNGIITVKEAKYYLDERDRVDLESFIALSWPRIKPMYMLAEGIFKVPPNDEEQEKSEPAIQSADEHGRKVNPASEVEFAQFDDSEAKDMAGAEGAVEQDQEEEEDEEMYEGDETDEGTDSVTEISTPLPEYDPETQHFVDVANEARNSYAESERELQDIDNELKDLEKHNAKDYGPHDEYASLEGECYKLQDNEYIYTLCPFERASQQGSGGGSETTLGRWDEWEADGTNKYAKQKYSHGASCWNGPQRSVVVHFKCALETRIAAVSEPDRCVYHFNFETPASCDQEAFDRSEQRLRDEL